MAVRWVVGLVLLAALAHADVRRDEDGCKGQTIAGSPEGVLPGVQGCHIATDRNTGISYRFNGIAGETTGWLATEGPVHAGVCGDGIVNGTPTRPEECDAPNGMGQIGSCALIADCQSNCTCSPASPCGNGVLDGGEACDDSVDGGPCDGRCTAACKCACACGDGIINVGCDNGTSETCDFTPATGIDFVTAVDFTGGHLDTNVESALDVTDGQIIWEFDAECDTFPASGSRITWKGGSTTGTVGYGLLILSNGALRIAASDATNAATATSPAGFVVAGQLAHFAVTRDGSNAVTMQKLNITAGDTTHTPASSVTLSTTAPTSWSSLTSWGNSATDFQIGARDNSADPIDCRIDNLRIRTCANGGTCVTDFLAGPLDVDWDDVVTTGPAVTAAWKFDAASTATITDMVSGTIATAVGSLSLVPSPFSTASTSPTACSGSQTCNPTTCICGDSGTSNFATRYIDDTGNDTAACTTGAPCKTAQWVMCGNSGCNNPQRLKPGDTLLFKDGTYPPLTVSCGVNMVDGTADAPITLKCENERQCRLDSTGTTPALVVEDCAYVVLEGFDARTTDNPAAKGSSNHTVADLGNDHVTFRRILTNQNQRCGNNHNFKSVGSQFSLYEENEAWNHSRHAFSCTGSKGNIWRRNYANNNGRTQSVDTACVPDPMNVPGGTSRESFAIYPCTESLMENNLVEGSQAWGYNVEMTPNDFGGARTSNVRILGNIAANTKLGAKIFTRDQAFQGLFATVIRDFLSIENVDSFGIRDSVSVATVYDNVAVINSNAAGVAAMQVDDPCTTPPCTAQLACSELTGGAQASVTISDALFCGNDGPGLNVTACNGSATRLCTLSNIRSNNTGTNYQDLASACAGSGGDQCACTSTVTTACTGFGVTGTDCVTRPISGLGPDLRCKTVNGITGSGSSNNLWWQSGDTTPGGPAIAVDGDCDDIPGAGATRGCVGGFKFCGATVAGVNDETDNCRTYAQRWLNHQPDNNGCPAATFGCP